MGGSGGEVGAVKGEGGEVLPVIVLCWCVH